MPKPQPAPGSDQTGQAKVFRFLDHLREGGATNMFEAAPYIMEEFQVNNLAAGRLLICWMESFESEVLP